MGPVVGLLGGLCWVVRWVVEMIGFSPGWSGPVHWMGLGLLCLALAAVGAGLVSRSALWLRVIVALAFPLLVWSVYTVLRGSGDDPAFDGVVGLLAVVLSVVAVMAARRSAAPPPVARGGRHGSHGSHAAR